ncbi:Gmad2 immunoglobulin-like domain-containing protein [Desmospora profundinema]|uniref:Bacterial spore germination immunoglobulin-like domain-containing protein n=1 Tax=Desmospora profundinema TaxID=1571184 RepID=A0ABU1ISB8_9BACL|nr:Gmad2 immunoglobulin-like domain-containing protein [Desmospora profundinema]MDR6226660.1 hypothetical protein [Desmospora profundinema]
MKKWFLGLLTLTGLVVAFPTLINANVLAEEDQFFRHVKVSKPQVEYQIEGKARVFEGTYHYRVKDGKETVVQGWGTASAGGPEWGDFKQTIQIPKSKSAMKKNLKLELFEESAKDGSEVNKLVVPLKAGSTGKKNAAFKNIRIDEPKVKYRVSGEARVYEGTYHFAVSDGHDYLVEGWGTASMGAPEWGKFKETIDIPLKEMPVNGTLIMELFEISMKDGQRVHQYEVVLDQTPWK